MTRPVVGIGELLWDVFPDGRRVAGGAPFNFAFHCRQLGHAGTVVSRVGDDELGRELRAEVRRLGMSDEFIQTDPERPTGTVEVTLDAAGVPAYRITEGVAWDAIAWDERTARLMYSAGVICYGSLVGRTAPARATLRRLLRNSAGFDETPDGTLFQPDWLVGGPPDWSQRRIVFDVNLRQHYYDRDSLREGASRASWLKLNDDELAVFASLFGFDAATAPAALDQFHHVCGVDPEVVCLTRGAEGACVRWIEVADSTPAPANPFRAHVLDEPAPPANVIDTVGAGDAFTAAMVCLTLEGRPLPDALRFALHYAARVCEHRGATPAIDRAEVERAALGTP